MVLALVLDIFYPKKCQEPGSWHSSWHIYCQEPVLDTYTIKNQFLTVSRTSSWQCQEPVLYSVKNQFLTVSRTSSWQCQEPGSWQSSWHIYCQEPVLDTFTVKNQFLTVSRTSSWHSHNFTFQPCVDTLLVSRTGSWQCQEPVLATSHNLLIQPVSTRFEIWQVPWDLPSP